MGRFNFLRSSTSKSPQSSASQTASTASARSSSIPSTSRSSPPADNSRLNCILQPSNNVVQATQRVIENSTLSPQSNISTSVHNTILSNGANIPSVPVSDTLTWQIRETTAPIRERGSRDNSNENLDDVREDPPSYYLARRRLPERPITYKLSMIGKTSSAGLLLPPPNFPNPRPLYYIAVCNSFIWPNCLITSLFRGSSAEGHYVGGFSTILSVYPHRTDPQTFTNLQTVTLGSKEVPTAQLFELSETSHAVYVFRWRVQEPSNALVWECPNWPLAGKGTIQCSHLLAPKVTIAHYAPNKRLTNMLATHPPPEPLLTITPQGHKHIDDIVLSLLVMERERLAFANRIATY